MDRRRHGEDHDAFAEHTDEVLLATDEFLTELSQGHDPSEGRDELAQLLLDFTDEVIYSRSPEPPLITKAMMGRFEAATEVFEPVSDVKPLLGQEPDIVPSAAVEEEYDDTDYGPSDYDPSTDPALTTYSSAYDAPTVVGRAVTGEEPAVEVFNDPVDVPVDVNARRTTTEYRDGSNAGGDYADRDYADSEYADVVEFEPRRKKRRVGGFVSGLIGAAAATLVIAGGGMAVYNAEPGSLLWGLNTKLFGDHAAVVELASTLEEADNLNSQGDVDGALALLEQAKALVQDINSKERATARRSVEDAEQRIVTETVTVAPPPPAEVEPQPAPTVTITNTVTVTVPAAPAPSAVPQIVPTTDPLPVPVPTTQAPTTSPVASVSTTSRAPQPNNNQGNAQRISDANPSPRNPGNNGDAAGSSE